MKPTTLQLFLKNSIWVSFLLASCNAAPQCLNGTIEEDEATAIIDCINQARRKLADGMETTVNEALLPPAKDMNDLHWDCDIEKALVETTNGLCNGQATENFYWLWYQPEYTTDLQEYLTNYIFTEIKDDAPEITNDGVFYNNSAYGDTYPLVDYLNLMKASAQKFACIELNIKTVHCNGYNPNLRLLYCATEQAWLRNGDMVYEIAKTTTSAVAEATTSAVETSTALNLTTTSLVTTSAITTSLLTTSSTESNITQCGTPSTTPSCATVPSRRLKRELNSALNKDLFMKKSNNSEKERGITQSPRRVRREAKAAPLKSFMKKAAPAKRRGKTHRKQLRNAPMTPTAHGMHAAKTAGEN